MDLQERNSRIAALLDGEVRDLKEVEQLSALIQADPGLKAEYEEQRVVKRLLGSLPECSAPGFMSTRIMGEISARRRLQRRFGVRIWAAAAGGFSVCLMAVLALGQFFAPAQQMMPMLARNPQVGNSQYPLAVGTLTSDNVYQPQDWQAKFPEDIEPQVEEFLQFVREAHSYRRMQHAADAVSPDMPSAVLVVNEEGGR